MSETARVLPMPAVEPLLGRRLEAFLGAPVELRPLKHKPGRRLTLAARGRRGRAVVKVYRSDRAEAVGARIGALSGGPGEPSVPRVLLVDPGMHLVVLSWVNGITLRSALVEGHEDSCRRAGAALGRWHRSWWGADPGPLEPHSLEREVEILHAAAARSAWGRAESVVAHARLPASGWSPCTVVHRDLYEEQILLGGCVGLIDLDDAALGPPELDVGNLLGHVQLLALRAGRSLARSIRMVLDGYGREGPVLDPTLLDVCRRLTLLRLACIHAEPRLADDPSVARR